MSPLPANERLDLLPQRLALGRRQRPPAIGQVDERIDDARDQRARLVQLARDVGGVQPAAAAARALPVVGGRAAPAPRRLSRPFDLGQRVASVIAGQHDRVAARTGERVQRREQLGETAIETAQLVPRLPAARSEHVVHVVVRRQRHRDQNRPPGRGLGGVRGGRPRQLEQQAIARGRRAHRLRRRRAGAGTSCPCPGSRPRRPGRRASPTAPPASRRPAVPTAGRTRAPPRRRRRTAPPTPAPSARTRSR